MVMDSSGIGVVLANCVNKLGMVIGGEFCQQSPLRYVGTCHPHTTLQGKKMSNRHYRL